jgi:hypothetical protein
MTDDNMDELLSAPLPPLDDRGFSVRVLSAISAARDRRALLELCGLLAVACIFLAFLPLTALADTIDTVMGDLGNSLPVAMAALAIVLSLSLARIVAD